jgi:hypothetical protein
MGRIRQGSCRPLGGECSWRKITSCQTLEIQLSFFIGSSDSESQWSGICGKKALQSFFFLVSFSVSFYSLHIRGRYRAVNQPMDLVALEHSDNCRLSRDVGLEESSEAACLDLAHLDGDRRPSTLLEFGESPAGDSNFKSLSAWWTNVRF